MNSQLRRTLACVLVGVVTMAVAACDGGSKYWISILSLGKSNINKSGDTVSFAATEWRKPFIGPEEVISQTDFNPERFTWFVRDSVLAEVVAPGRVFMKATGTPWLYARTRHVTDSIRVHIDR